MIHNHLALDHWAYHQSPRQQNRHRGQNGLLCIAPWRYCAKLRKFQYNRTSASRTHSNPNLAVRNVETSFPDSKARSTKSVIGAALTYIRTVFGFIKKAQLLRVSAKRYFRHSYQTLNNTLHTRAAEKHRQAFYMLIDLSENINEILKVFWGLLRSVQF